jgi:elongation factor 1 alpha-like protein
MSKLQALAAARKKKAQEKTSGGDTGVEKPMAGLKINEDTDMGDATEKPTSRGFPLRKRKDTNEHEKAPKAPPIQKQPDPSTPPPPEEPPQQAEPSAFASTMFSSPPEPSRQPSEDLFTLPYTASSSSAASNPFSGPSPDDIVIAAQSKGSTISTKGKK